MTGPETLVEVSSREELAAAIREHAGTSCRISWGSFSITFREVSEFELLEFHARRGRLNDTRRSTWSWWKGWELIEAEGSKKSAKPPLGFASFSEYLVKMHPSRNWFKDQVERMAQAGEKMPRKAWPKT